MTNQDITRRAIEGDLPEMTGRDAIRILAERSIGSVGGSGVFYAVKTLVCAGLDLDQIEDRIGRNLRDDETAVYHQMRVCLSLESDD